MRISLSKHVKHGLLAFGLLVLILPTVAVAGTPLIDDGRPISSEAPYEEAVEIPEIFTSKGVYGKLEGETGVDIYKFTVPEDGDQTFTLLGRPQDKDLGGEPVLIFTDPTDATEESSIPLPLPDEGDYHHSLIQPPDNPEGEDLMYYEPGTLTNYRILAQQRIPLKKDTTYYVLILDPSYRVQHYVLKIGEGRAWSFGDVFQNFGAWLQVKSDAYGATNPFTFPPAAVGMLILLLGFLSLAGTWLVHETFSMMANRSTAAAYLLIKMQPFSRIFYWVGLWFTLLGGYIYFNKVGWNGIPFVMFWLFLVLAGTLVYQTFPLSKQLAALEVSKREATIPLPLRKRLYVTFALSTISLISLLVFFAMYIAGK